MHTWPLHASTLRGFSTDLGAAALGRVEQLDLRAARRCAEPRRRRAGVELRSAAAVLQPAEDAARGRRGHQGHRLAGLPSGAPGRPRPPTASAGARADSSRDNQDEYCEWSVTRDPESDKITRVTFTSEGPEYWQFLAAVSPARVVELYRQHVSPDVQQADLFRNGRYVRRNSGTTRRPRARCTSCSAATRWARKSSSPRPPRSSACAAARRSPKPRR